jgi:hypothetical protein
MFLSSDVTLDLVGTLHHVVNNNSGREREKSGIPRHKSQVLSQAEVLFCDKGTKSSDKGPQTSHDPQTFNRKVEL